MSDILLVDGDMLVFRSLKATEKEIKWGDDIWTLHANESEGQDRVVRFLEEALKAIPARSIIIAISSDVNFRKGLWPAYKGNRADVRKPLGYRPLIDDLLSGGPLMGRLRGTFDKVTAVCTPGVEADDTIGILATKPGNVGRTVILSQDKDFRGVPGKLWRGGVVVEGGKLVPNIEDVSEEEADRWHLAQALGGDQADGYPGCPGIGVETALDLLSKGLKFQATERTITKGKRQGVTETVWERVASESPWATVTSCFAKAGLGEADALLMARLARILRWDDFDRDKREPRLWTPKVVN